MTVVFACADPQVAGGVVLPSGHADLLQFLRGLPAGTLICTTLSAGPAVADLRRCLRAGVRPDVRAVGLSLPPTAVPVLASVLAAGWFPAGAVLALEAEVSAACPTVAVADAVGRLEEPAPSVLQHAMGWLPGVWFGIDPRGGVVRRNWTPSASAGRPAAITVSASTDDPASQRRREHLEGATPGQRLLRVTAAGSGRWGARRWAEVTAVLEPLDDLARRLHPRVLIVTCSWCGSAVSVQGCPFCGIVPVRPDVPARPTGSVAW